MDALNLFLTPIKIIETSLKPGAQRRNDVETSHQTLGPIKALIMIFTEQQISKPEK